MLSGRGFCVGLITHPEESYRLWCVVVCDLDTSCMRRPWPTGGFCVKKKKRRTSLLSLFDKRIWNLLYFQNFVFLSFKFRVPYICKGRSQNFLSFYDNSLALLLTGFRDKALSFFSTNFRAIPHSRFLRGFLLILRSRLFIKRD